MRLRPGYGYSILRVTSVVIVATCVTMTWLTRSRQHYLSLVHKEAKELLNFLVDAHGLAVCLRVVSHGRCNFNSEYLAETLHEV